MKLIKFLAPVFAVACFVVSCSTESAVSPDAIALSDEAVVEELLKGEPDLQMLSKNGVYTSTAPVFSAEDGREIGVSYAAYNERGVQAVLKTTELQPGSAVTLWWVFFNDPSQCSGPCDDDDLTRKGVGADILYADGQYIDQSGRGVFVARRKIADKSGSINRGLLGIPAVGLIDTEFAEAHLVVRDHGPVLPGLESEMTTTFGGGCNDAPASGVLGTPGPNTCADIQFAAHELLIN